MGRIIVKDKKFKSYISEAELQDAINKVAQQINTDYKAKSPIFIGVLNGSFMFMSDLLKKIDLQCTVSFVKLASYEGTATTGKVSELIGLNEDLKGHDIILVEDIVDTGNTLIKLYEILEEKKVTSIKIASLLFKPGAYKKSHSIDYVGKEIPNAFVIGYGLDYDGLGRNLSSIYVLDEN
ncbi:MAG: hypoxanthine phosphoribosyltransferase [Flavobacteriales bacterium CG18_big_fil_WC_8_21_14_2_50_32_9]|nr:MAG: hypoxanthine phosphoribosyltransferase [Flavobacteriales bacterium CG18_big_fil_WC_8_21_14_2_50_32_9]PJC62229.1 MAG: hypoxanthine phosphoribosyltransferase [Flavobacteriales bacterium CG_4_9_14_0_2_um_filter_32_27]